MSALGQKRTRAQVASKSIVSAGKRLLHYLSIICSQLIAPDFVSQLVDRSSKAEWELVTVVHCRAGIHPDVERFVERHQERDSMLYCLARQHLPIHGQYASAAFAGSGTVVLEVEHDGVFARRQRGS